MSFVDTTRAEKSLQEAIWELDNYVDPLERFEGDRGDIWLPVGRSYGPTTKADWQPFRADVELDSVRDYMRAIWRDSEWAQNALENHVNYTVGTGHVVTVETRLGRELPATTLAAAQALVDEFMESSEWEDRQAELVLREHRDGESFLRFFDDFDRGTVRVRFIEPESVRTPAASAVSEPVRLGVMHTPGDVETIAAYAIDGQWVPASVIQHRKINVDRTHPRGLSTLWSIRDNLRRAAKLLRNISLTAQIQTSIALIRKHTGNRAAVTSFEQRTRSGTVQGADGRTIGRKRYEPGSVLDAPDGVEYDFPASGLRVGDYVGGLQAELRATAARLVMPEYMLTSDASNANYSSTLVAEGPTVKKFQREQRRVARADAAVFRRVLAVGEAAGRLPPGTASALYVVSQPPVIVSRDRLKDVQADAIQISGGVMSRWTARERDGLDPEREEERIQEEAEASGVLPDLP